MADNIKIIGNIINTTTVSRYDIDDTNLIPATTLKEYFGGKDNYIEYYIYDIGENLLSTNYNYLDYKLPTNSSLSPITTPPPNTTGNIQTNNIGIISTLDTGSGAIYPIIEIDPIKDLQNLGYSSGEFLVKYNFFQNKISDFSNEALFVKEISSDRTEIRLASTTLTDEQIESGSLILIEEINNTPTYYVDYLLNFGNNEQYIAVNVALNKDINGYEILFKLYQPLPLTIQEKQTLWVVQEQATPYVFEINLDKLITPAPPPTLRKPNFDITIENQGTISTVYGNYSNLISNLQSLQSSSYSQIQNLLNTQSIDINVDYTDFDNFAFFGSTFQRVTNFYNKVKEIEDSKNFINKYTTSVATTASLQTTINQYSASINTIISQFDGYEYYLYFESSSYAWPKSGSLKPYSLLSTGSATTLTWYSALTGSAQDYDSNNYDNLEFAVPAFIRDDENNQPFLLFLNMIGQYFDNIWIYLKSVTNINLANNNLETGISKDLVYQQLKSLGVKLYNSQAGESVDGYLIGANTGSSIFDNNFTITGSYLNNIPRKDLVAELYKRIYHNLPLLLKTKGTVAGLEYLTSTFGIPSKTYYTIGSESFYTPTGSSITASILNVKEFGGSNKAKLIKGYNTDKVRIVTNVITGSVLHPELSLQTFPTASSAFIDDDLHYIDISFSPQTQIDTYISKSISSNNPTWSLDNYIGDPRQQYTSSYSDLDDQRKLYFETGVPGFNPFTASLLDYNGFIRLIEYFDNSLFKMLADFVPERASLSTGITINSPVLERNKAVYSVPNVYTQSINEAEYPATSITAQYGKLYDDMLGDKKPFFTGEISGSIVNIHQYFEDNNNSYLDDWDVYNLQHTISQSIDMNSFLHSDWNVLLNNVSKSVESNIRKNIEYIYGTTGSITSSAQLQDSNLSLTSYVNSRYEGAKVTSLLYNTYTSASYTGSNGFTIVTGDKSFGKTAAIDHNSYKVGWVNSIPSQSLNFFDKTSINLKYLVDSNNEVYSLSKGNLNLPEVQRIFKSGTPVLLSISDVKNPSNQVTLDGNKTIFRGGYSYDPIIYREANETLNFRHDNYISSSIGFLGVKAYCNDNYRYFADKRDYRATLHFPPSSPAGNSSQDNYLFEINKSSANTYGIPMSNVVYDENTWKYKNNGLKVNFSVPSTFPGYRQNGKCVYSFDLLDFNNTSSNGGYNTEPDPLTYQQLSNGNHVYKVPRNGPYTIKAKSSFIFEADDRRHNPAFGVETGAGAVAFKVVGVIETCPAGVDPTNENNWSYLDATTLQTISTKGQVYVSSNDNAIWYDNIVGHNIFYLNINSNQNLTVNQLIRYQFYLIDLSNLFGNNVGDYKGTDMFNFYLNGVPPGIVGTSLDTSYFEIFDTNTPITIYNFNSSYGAIPPLFTTSSINTLIFNTSASYLFTTASTFLPTAPVSNYYSPVVDYFGIQKYDLLRIGSFNSPIAAYYEITNVSSSATNVYVTLDRSIDSLSYNNAQSFALLRPKEDETSVIINYKKQLGEVSQTILVPHDANDTIKNSIGNIFKTLNTDLK